MGALSDAPDTVLATNGGGTKTGKTFSLESDPCHDHIARPLRRRGDGPEFRRDGAWRLARRLRLWRRALRAPISSCARCRYRPHGGGRRARDAHRSDSFAQGIKWRAIHFTARVADSVPASDVEARAKAFVKTLKTDKPVVPASAVYEAYFHGPRFQVLAGLLAAGDTELMGLYRTPPAPLWDKGGRALMFQPMLIEAAFQTCGFRDLNTRKKMTLPDSIESVRVHDAGTPPKELLVYAHWRGAVDAGDGGDRSLYDACVLGRDGKVWATLTGYRMIAVS